MVGEGGGEPETGVSSPSGDSGEVGDVAELFEATRLALLVPDFPLVVDLTEPASDLSTPPSMLPRALDEALGLSVALSDFTFPGIFDRIEPRNDFTDSFVSDLLKDGYDCRLSLGPLSREVDDAFLGVLEPSLPFDCC